MVGFSSSSTERKLKALIPSVVKRGIVDLLCSRSLGIVLQKFARRTMHGVRFPFRSIEPDVVPRVYFGIWESAEVRFANRFVSDGDYVVELGSSIGVTMANLLEKKNLQGYLAVEPNPHCLDVLTQVANLSSIVTIVPKAIHYGAGEVAFSGDAPLESGRVEHGAGAAMVQTTTVSEILQLNHIRDQAYVLISDIEGAEVGVLENDLKCLDNCKLLLCELEDSEGRSVEWQLETIVSCGFVVVEHYGNVYVFGRRAI